MSAPVISSITVNKNSFTPGDEIEITIQYVPGTEGTSNSTTTTVTGTNTDTGEPTTVTVSFVVGTTKNSPTTWEASDTDGRKYTLKSDNGSVAVLTATA